MAFRTPPPWNPGYATPDYMKAEGLQSRAFVTKWAPRGTYDDPDAFDPSWDKSYATPGYIKAEGYGQGVFVSEWPPRGFWVGQVKRTAKRIKTNQRAMGDVVMPGPFAAYGRQAAAAVLVRVRSLPPEMRKDGLRKIMRAIDPTLYDKTQRYAQEHVARGVPAAMAVELGMARAMSTGIADEIIDVGKKGRRPAARGQLGLGCYGALGQTAPKAAFTLTQAVTAILPQTAPPQVGQCSADGLYIWKLADGAGYWARRSASDVCIGTYSGAGPVTGGTQGGVTGSGTGAPAPAPTVELKMMQVGPLQVPLNSQFTIHWSTVLPAEWQSWLIAQLSRDADRDTDGSYIPKTYTGNLWSVMRKFIPGAKRVNRNFIGWDIPEAGYNNIIPPQPIVVVKRPDNGEDWAIFLQIGLKDRRQPYDETANPYVANLLWRKKPDDVWDWIKRIVGKIIDFVGEVLDTVGGIACNLLNTQGAALAASGAAASQGAPPATGAQGVQIAQAACGQQPPPTTASEEEGWLVPVAIAGGALVALALILKKKKT